MAKKKSKKAQRLKRLARAKAKEDTSAMLKEAVLALRRGGSERAISLASGALDFADTPAQAKAARELLAEAHFRAAVEAAPQARLTHLEAALEAWPEDHRLRFYRAISLWQLGRIADAAREFETVYKEAPQRPGVAYLYRLARLALGIEELDDKALSEAEAGTLRLLASLLKGSEPPTGPLLGSEALWWALAEMARDPTAQPIARLKEAAASARPPAARQLARYYLGVAALRAGDVRAAEAAWSEAQAGTFSSEVLEHNLRGLRRERLQRLAEQGRWQEMIKSVDEAAADDRALGEMLALAHEQLGYTAAQAGDWRKAARHWRAAEGLAGRRQLAQNLALAEEALENWAAAGDAWRAVLRRRPRKVDHPDYVSDDQVAAIWRHAGQCYQRADNFAEAINCFKQALKYAPSELEPEIRLELAETLFDNDQPEAGQNELERLLARDPNHVGALMRLGASYQGDWRRDVMPIWRRVLKLEPDNREAREALAQAYLEHVHLFPLAEARKRLEKGLDELPEHPRLLLALSMSHEGAKARELLLRAYHAAPDELPVVRLVMRQLACEEAEDELKDIVQSLRENAKLLPGFWLSQGEELLEAGLDPFWAQRFFDEGVSLAERLQDKPSAEVTKAGALVYAFEAALIEEDEVLAHYFEERILAEVPNSGAVEYSKAYRLFHEEDDVRGAKRLLKEARRKAQEVGDRGILHSIEFAEERLKGPAFPFDIGGVLERLKDRL